MRRRPELPRGLLPGDRRQHERRPYGNTLWLQCAGETTWFEVHGRDVSAGGFAFVSAVSMSVGETVLVSLPEMSSEMLGATVRRASRIAEGWLVGIEFDVPLDHAVERALIG